jgi:hypothetical protein
MGDDGLKAGEARGEGMVGRQRVSGLVVRVEGCWGCWSIIGEVARNLRGQQGLFVKCRRSGPAVAIYSILQASESCLLGGVRKARTDVVLIVRIGSRKSEYGPISFRVGLVL